MFNEIYSKKHLEWQIKQESLFENIDVSKKLSGREMILRETACIYAEFLIIFLFDALKLLSVDNREMLAR